MKITIEPHWRLLLLTILFVIRCVFTQQREIEPPLTSLTVTERLALLDLRSSLGLRASDWPIKTDPCNSWTGVQCRNGFVTGINISGLKRTRLGRLNPHFSVDSLANFTRLVSFNASKFSLPGPIPAWFGYRLGSLQVLDLRSCSITGELPISFGNLSSLRLLYLADNNISGSVLDVLVQLKNLSIVDLSNNRITDSIPWSFSLLKNVTSLDFSFNYMYGSIPTTFGSIRNLQVLNLSHNVLTASIPRELGNLSKLEVVDLSVNRLEGAIPSALLSLPRLRVVDLSRNNFTGPLPSFSLNRYAAFNLSNNLLYGSLKSFYWNHSLIDLSGNYIQGKFPRTSASVERNCLQNASNQRSLDDCRMFYAEIGLHFDDFEVLEPKTESKSCKRWIFILAGLFGGLVFISILVFILMLVLRRTSNVGPVPEGDNNPPPLPKVGGESYTYEQLLRSTSGFSETNLIKHGHSGFLYRGILEGGAHIIVKKVDLKNSHKKESYMTELNVFSKASHTKLIGLLGICLEHETEKFLVYKYMPNGDLGSSSFTVEGENLQSLDWITRLKIALGAAAGLSYLHHECSPPLVHRDIQASSILLDDKFEVRLGSLSEVCAQEGGDAHPSVLSRFLQKPPLSEPGPSSGSSSASCAYDVYCFGKVLLELVTGKVGMSKSDDATTSEWLEQTLPCISICDKELVTKIVDPSLIIDEDLLEEVWAMAIVARSCLNPKAYKRPPMKYVVKALENPVRVVREESFNSRATTSSRRSWSAAAFFGSWRHSSFEKQSGRIEHWSSSFHKRLSNEIFPEEPLDIERL